MRTFSGILLMDTHRTFFICINCYSPYYQHFCFITEGMPSEFDITRLIIGHTCPENILLDENYKALVSDIGL